MKKYRCPVCKTPLTKKEYEKALGILSARDKHHEDNVMKLQKKLREARANEKRAKQEGINTERTRNRRLLAGKDKQIQTLKERIKQVKKGTTPQTEGLEFENKLVACLKKEFPEDSIQHKGKDGDVLHVVKFAKKSAGIIIYECKRVAKIQSQHIRQTYRAKQSREADFAVLVTTGQKRGFSGFSQMNGVLVVAPLGVVALASLLRRYLIEMMKAKVKKAKRAKIARQLMEYITSPQFKNPIEEVIQISSELQSMVQDEAKDHFRVWRKRWLRYQKIEWDSSQI
ncbi:DUF2130 domain-containing protein [candidate division WOR-3 bacterium]|nr:DUF2130 domain-containing protein [candidate division WOR-3 bacterium]